jgi:transposase
MEVMRYMQGKDRQQVGYTLMCLDELIEDGNLCRIIEGFIQSLDMGRLGFKYGTSKERGRKAYDPSQMMGLYLYGYCNRIRSSRRLEVETHRNIEVMWLMNNLTPDDKTISNFRRENAEAIKKVFRGFSVWCNREGLYGKSVVGVDSTKVRANASRKSIHTRKGTEKQISNVEKEIERYMKALEVNEKREGSKRKVNVESIQKEIKRLKERKAKLEEWKERIEKNEGKEISAIDPDAHMMHSGGDARGLDACYNVQVVVEEKNKLIVDFEVTTCPDDSGALSMMTESAKGIMEVEGISVIADKGYYYGADIVKCEESGTKCYIPKSEKGTNMEDMEYLRENFVYDKEKDCYICPEGKELSLKETVNKGSEKEVKRYYNKKECDACEKRSKCTKNKSRGRTIDVKATQQVLERVAARMATEEGKGLFKERKKIVEHPFGTTKAVWGYKQYLVRKQTMVTCEQTLICLAYNIRRIMTIYGGKQVRFV